MDLLEYESISAYLTSDKYPPNFTKDQKRNLRRKASKYRIFGEKLVKPFQNQHLMVIMRTEVGAILTEIHDNSGHQCSRYTYNIAKDRYYWPSMLKDIEPSMLKDNQRSLKSPTVPLQPLPVITKVWFRVGMDLTGPLVESNGYKYILTVIDHFTRWIETRPLRTKEAMEVARGLFSIYCRQGAPVQIISDNGTEFTNKLHKSLHEAYDCKLIFSTPYHPQTNGLVESSHKALKRSLVKTLDGRKENWSVYLEEITFSLNIRPRQTTQFYAFEFMHGSFKPRLLIQADNLAALYPDAGALDLDEWAGEEQINEFIDTMQEAQMDNQEIAGESLKHSKTLMKRQYDKRLNLVTLNTIEKGDEVLIENVYQRKKGGKLEDKWLGPYLADEVNPTNVRVSRNKSIQRVKKSKIKLWKKRSQPVPGSPSSKRLRLDADFESNEEEIITSPFLGQEEIIPVSSNKSNRSREEILQILASFKSKIINSILTSTPLSQLHSQLHIRSHFDFRDLLDWRYAHYPSINSEEIEMDLDTTQEITEVLAQFYLESYEVKIPEYQYTCQDFEFSTKWATDSMNYATKVLLPVVKELLAAHFEPLVASESQTIFEEMCATWGGHYDGVKLINTCSIDNFITLLSLHKEAILTAFDLTGESPNSTLRSIFSMVNEQNFDKLRLWTAPKLGMPISDSECNMSGY